MKLSEGVPAMALKRCPHCGEKYSDTYKNCPFCEEEEALRGGRKIRRSGKRTGGKRQINLLTPTLFVLILIMGALLLYLLFGDRFQKDPAREENKPSVEEVKPQQPEVEEPDVTAPDGTQMPEDPDVTEPDPGTTTAPTVPIQMAFFRSSSGSLWDAMAITTALSPASTRSRSTMDISAPKNSTLKISMQNPFLQNIKNTI